MNYSKSSFFTQLGILTKRLLLRLARRPLAELPNIFISAFFLLVYDGALGGVFGGNAAGTPFDFANGNFLNFILPVSIVSASVSGGASGIYLVEDIESGVFKRYQGMPISKWAIILAPIVVGAVRVLLQATLIMTLGSIIGADPATGLYRIFCSLRNGIFLGNGICWVFCSSRCKIRFISRRTSSYIFIFSCIIFSTYFYSKICN